MPTLHPLLGAVSVQSTRKPTALDLQRRNTDQMPAGLGLVALSDLQSMAREEGEGMETTETENLSPALTPLPSLEQLLTSPDPKQGVFSNRGALTILIKVHTSYISLIGYSLCVPNVEIKNKTSSCYLVWKFRKR